ncbi:hypothetical protein MMC10_000605 [Thelotrema lepadinum]|nr:hypothetical protein [Thelotrema lepadinum]
MHRRGILFDQDKTEPQFVWVECRVEREEDPDPLDYEFPNPGPFFGGKHGLPATAGMMIQKNERRGQDLINTIEVTYSDSFLIDGSRPTRSLIKAIGKETAYTPHWRGPVLLMQRKGLGRDPPLYGDITLEDFSHALDAFTLYDDEGISTIMEGYRRDDSIRGVKVSCVASQKLLGTPPFVPVEVANWQPGRESRDKLGEISPLSKMLGLPVRVWRMRRSYWSEVKLSHGENPEKNDFSARLFLEPDLASPKWGRAQGHWTYPAGDLLLVNANGGNLTLEDAEALCRFCKEKLQPMFEDALGGGLVQRTNQEVLDFIKPESLRRFKEELSKERVA